ncbi:MAG: type II toxin-antitoxin system RelE/ParE family toxin [Hyphomicrobiales bacterium]|nr:type II toxin-antitoxin system RelE/ParE family toxin [Hyphomicrobiales bacterium]
MHGVSRTFLNRMGEARSVSLGTREPKRLRLQISVCHLYGNSVQFCYMKIISIRHRGLRRLLLENNPREVRPDQVARLRRILTELLAADSLEDIRDRPGWRIHRLVGDRAGTWSISVSANWRLTFRRDDDTISDLDLEDYH